MQLERNGWQVIQSRFKRDGDRWKATVEDLKLADKCHEQLSREGYFDPIGADRSRLTATDLVIVTTDNDHIHTLNHPNPMRWCCYPSTRQPLRDLDQWGRGTERLLVYPVQSAPRHPPQAKPRKDQPTALPAGVKTNAKVQHHVRSHHDPTAMNVHMPKMNGSETGVDNPWKSQGITSHHPFPYNQFFRVEGHTTAHSSFQPKAYPDNQSQASAHYHGASAAGGAKTTPGSVP